MKQRNVLNEIKKNQHLYFYIAIKKTYIYLFKYKKRLHLEFTKHPTLLNLPTKQTQMTDFQSTYKESQYKILFKEYYYSLVQFATHIIHDDETAKDFVQDLFVLLWEKELKFENELTFRTYLYRSIQHKCINHIRKLKIQLKHEKNLSEKIEQEENPSILHNLIKEEVYRQLFTSIDHLPPQCKKICLMTLDGKKPAEIAQELNLAVDTVKKQKNIALQKLQNELGLLNSNPLLLLFMKILNNNS